MYIFRPTWLYVKIHTVTGKMYLGKTVKDPRTYLGSGKYWRAHIKKHGTEFVQTLWCELFHDEESIRKAAQRLCNENKVVRSKWWANLVDENGVDGSAVKRKPGRPKGMPLSVETKEKMRLAKLGKPSNFKGKRHTREARIAISNSLKASYPLVTQTL